MRYIAVQLQGIHNVRYITYLPSILSQAWMVGILFSFIFIPVKRESKVILSLPMGEGKFILSLPLREGKLILSLPLREAIIISFVIVRESLTFIRNY